MRIAYDRKHEHLKDYSDSELLEILKNIEGVECKEIGYYCAEILRRLFEDKDEIFLPSPHLEDE